MHHLTRRHALAASLALAAGGAATGNTGAARAQAFTRDRPPVPLEVAVWGGGPPVVLVHGAVLNGPLTWKEQRPLGDHWRLQVPNRRGYGNSPPPSTVSDFEEDAGDIAALLESGAHLVGHSYGAIVALYAAALRPDAVLSLVLNEPPLFGWMKGDAAAEAIVKAQAGIGTDLGPREWVAAFARTTAGPDSPAPAPLPEPLPPAIQQGIRTAMLSRRASEADPVHQVEALRGTKFPKLVTSGGHSPVFEAICDRLQRELKTQRAVIRGAGHNVQLTGAPFNDKLDALWRVA